MDAVDLGAQANDCAADLVALVELLADKRHGEPLPTLVEQRRVILHREYPLPAIRVRFVLPHRFDARLEQVVVRIALQFGGRLEPVEVPAIRLDRLKLADGRQARFVGTGVGRRWVRAICSGHRRVRYLCLCVMVYRPYIGEEGVIPHSNNKICGRVETPQLRRTMNAATDVRVVWSSRQVSVDPRWAPLLAGLPYHRR